MGTVAIQTLKPNVSQNEAVQAFSARGVFSFYWKMRSGPLQRIADAYVPFWLYHVRYNLGKAQQTRLFAMDAVDGSLDLFEFPKPPGQDELLAVETRNCLLPLLSDAQAEEILREKVWRVIFQQGFFKIREPKLEVAREAAELYLPYWLGLYGGQNRVRCRVMDAVRRRMEGAKASAFFEGWLAA
jgi:hypothetical protein